MSVVSLPEIGGTDLWKGCERVREDQKVWVKKHDGKY